MKTNRSEGRDWLPTTRQNNGQDWQPVTIRVQEEQVVAAFSANLPPDYPWVSVDDELPSFTMSKGVSK